MTRSITPSRSDLVDTAFLAALTAVALLGLRTTFDGWAFLPVGMAGLTLGTAIALLTAKARLPVITTAAATVGAYFIVGSALVTPSLALGGVLPTVASLRALADNAVHGWMRLLTTLPPVDDALAVPYLLGLACGAVATTLAARTKNPALPLIGPLATLAAVILLGTDDPGLPWLTGAGFAVIALGWSAFRHGARRPLPALALLTVSAAVAVLAAPPYSADDRVVLRDLVEPPLDLSAYASPLVGYRKYTEPANLLWDQTLFTVTGLPPGTPVRIATMDDYDGAVWGATADQGDFHRVGTTIPTTATGESAEVTVTIAAAYAASDDVNAWLPTVGAATSVRFDQPHAEWFRYNLATASGLVADRLRPGDAYTMRVVLPSTELPADLQPSGPPTLRPGATAFAASRGAQWAASATGVGPRLRAVADQLRGKGAYSSGGPNEAHFLPGHSVRRLSDFLNADQPVGDEEQYAAAFALIANDLGVPARVVLGATPASDGVVRGRDVRAWVEVHVADGRWVPIQPSEFMPDRSKKPDHTPPAALENTDASIVPPPNVVHPPSSLDDAAGTDQASRTSVGDETTSWQLPWLVVLLLTWAGPPLLVLAAVVGAVLTLKSLRRKRRRSQGSAVERVAGGWREIVDQARDLGITVPTGGTRRDEAEALTGHGVGGLALLADVSVFGQGVPAESSVAGYWSRVDQARRAMTANLSRRRRWAVALSPRSLRRRRGTA